MNVQLLIDLLGLIFMVLSWGAVGVVVGAILIALYIIFVRED